MSINLNPIGNPEKVGGFNNNFTLIEEELNNNVLRRDGLSPGEANQLEVDIDMNGHSLLNVNTDLEDEGSLVSLGDADFRYVGKEGSTMSGVLDMGDNIVNNLPAPVQANDATRKSYVDQGLASKVDKSGDSMSGSLDMSGNDVSNIRTTTTDNLILGGLPVSPGELSPNQVIWVDTIADLQALPTSGLVDGQAASVRGSELRWDDAGQRWVPVGAINIEAFGAKSDGSDGSNALQAAVAFFGDTVNLYIPVRTDAFYFAAGVTLPPGASTTICGDGTLHLSSVDPSAAMFVFRGGSFHASGIEFIGTDSQVKITSTLDGARFLGFSADGATTTKGVSLTNCTFRDCVDAVWLAGITEDFEYIEATGCRFIDIVRSALTFRFDGASCERVSLESNTHKHFNRTDAGGLVSVNDVRFSNGGAGGIAISRGNTFESIRNNPSDNRGSVYCTHFNGFSDSTISGSTYKDIRHNSTEPLDNCRAVETRPGLALVTGNKFIDVMPVKANGFVSLTGGGEFSNNEVRNESIVLSDFPISQSGAAVRFRGAAIANGNKFIGYNGCVWAQARVSDKDSVSVSGNTFTLNEFSRDTVDAGYIENAAYVTGYEQLSTIRLSIAFCGNTMTGHSVAKAMKGLRVDGQEWPVFVSNLSVLGNSMYVGDIMAYSSDVDGTSVARLSDNTIVDSGRLVFYPFVAGDGAVSLSGNSSVNSSTGLYSSPGDNWLVSGDNTEDGKPFEAEGSATIPDGVETLQVTHGVARQPDVYSAIARSFPNQAYITIDASDATTLTLRRSQSVGDQIVYWRARTQV